MDWYYYPIAIAAGMLAAIINTLAGSGSVITLAFLLSVGLPADIANGTNRIGVLVQSFVATGTFYKSGKLQPLVNHSWWIIIPMLIGAVLGAMTAVEIDEELLKNIIGGLMVLMLVLIVIKPKRWLRNSDFSVKHQSWWNILLFLGVGFYGGFIQMGMGIFFLAAAVLAARYSLVDSNLIKSLVVALFTIPVLFIFWYNGDVNWELGATIAIGQSFGAWLAARFAVNSPKAAIWIHRLLILMVIVAIIKLFAWQFFGW